MILKNAKTPLMYAALSWSAQSPVIVELLLKSKADSNATDYVSGWDRGWRGVPYIWLPIWRDRVILGCSLWVGGFRLT